MPKLTSDQAFALSRAFHGISVEIGNYRFSNFDNLTPAQRRRLEDLQFDVLNDSTKFNALSISGVLDDMQGALDRIHQTTERMNDAIKRLNDANRVIKIATAAVTLGAAIVSANPAAIVTAVTGAIESVS